MQVITKITTSDVIGRKMTIKEVIEWDTENPGQVKPLYRVFGIASSAVPDSTKYGEFFRIYGQFKAINVETGEEFASMQVILPGALEKMIAGQLTQGATGLQFGFEVGVKADETSQIGYSFTASSLLAAGNALSALEEQIKANAPALPAPGAVRLAAPKKGKAARDAESAA